MVLTPADRLVVRWSALQWGLQEGVYAVANATSHGDVVSGLNGILTTMATIPSTECVELLNNLNWTAVLDRCVCVSVLHLFMAYMSALHLIWMCYTFSAYM